MYDDKTGKQSKQRGKCNVWGTQSSVCETLVTFRYDAMYHGIYMSAVRPGFVVSEDKIAHKEWVYTGCPAGNVPDFGRMFLTLKYTDLTQNTYIRSWTVTEIMTREKCGLLVVPRTVPVSRVVTRTLRMSVLQSHSRVKHFPPPLSTDTTVTVNCNSIQLDIHVPCKVFGTLRTTTTLVRVHVV